MVKVQAVRESGVAFERLIAVRRKADAAVPLRLTLHSVLLKDTKPDGAKWDFGPPDPQCRIYINDILVKETVVAQDQFRFLKATEIDCEENDKVRIVVHDRDINFHDHAGDIEFVAKSGLTITKPSRGQIENCDITVRAIPVRLAIRR
jgi:hypothetical protein